MKRAALITLGGRRDVPAFLVFLFLWGWGAPSSPAIAEETLPYNHRVNPYSGYSGTVSGDIETVGIAGANVGLGDSVDSSNDNPAGLAMAFKGVQAQIAGNVIADGQVQSMTDPVSTRSIGIAGGFYPWGVSFGKRTTWEEGMRYQFGPGGPLGKVDIFTQEYRLSLARVLPGDRFALGASLILGRTVQEIEVDNVTPLNQFETTAVGANFGAMMKLPKRLLLGLSYATPIRYGPDDEGLPSVGITNLSQDVRTPGRFGLGLGWKPNRHVRAGISLLYIRPVKGPRLLKDDTTTVGIRPTWQPRLGFSYELIDIRDLRVLVATGTYYEMTRIQARANRFHWTGAIAIRPWIFSFGWVLDRAKDYKNHVFSGSINLIKLLRKMKVIPKDNKDLGGFFPRPFEISDYDMPRALSKHYKQVGHEKPGDYIGTAVEVPKKIGERFSNPVNPVKDLGTDIIDSFKSITTDFKDQIAPSKNKKKEKKD